MAETTRTPLSHEQLAQPALHDAMEVGGAVVGLESDPRLARIVEIDRLIDPDHTLPQVEFTTNLPAPNQGNAIAYDYHVAHDGQVVGDCIIQGNRKRQVAWFRAINMRGNTGKGFGMATYKAAIELAAKQGLGFRTHHMTQNEGAKRIWERLERLGVARMIEPFTPTGKGDGKYTGYYVVDPPQAGQASENSPNAFPAES